MHWKPDPTLYPPFLRARIRRGRGVGHGLEYVPWLKVRDVPSRGTSSVVSGIHVRRPYHLLSELEATYFFLIERRPSIIDIQEQWPILDIDQTLTLCAQTGVRHGYRGPYPEPFTIDFLITEEIKGKIRYHAASIKNPKDAANPQVRQRLAIEHAWCGEWGVPWTLVDTSRFDRTLLANLRFLRAWFTNRYEPCLDDIERFAQRFELYYRTNILLDELIQQVTHSLRLPESLARDTFLYCAWSDRITVSLQHPLSLGQPLILRRDAPHD